MIAPIVATTVAKSVVPTISVGLAELYVIRMAITVVGISVKLVVLSAKSVIIERLASSLSPFSF